MSAPAHILALDASYSASGIAYRGPDGTPVCYTFRVPRSTNPVGAGLLQITQHLSALCQSQHFTHCIKEALAFMPQGYGTTRLTEVAGIIKMVLSAHNIPLLEVAPASMKHIVTGSGRADKYKVRQEVRKWFAHQGYRVNPLDDNQSDALGILLVGETYLRTGQYLHFSWGDRKIAEVGKKLRMVLESQIIAPEAQQVA